MSALIGGWRVVVLAALTIVPAAEGHSQHGAYMRLNQVGFVPDDVKSCVVFSTKTMTGELFAIQDARTNRRVYETHLRSSAGAHGKFTYCYRVDFSPLTTPGVYVAEVAGARSFPFSIGDALYDAVVDSLMMFFRAQRCGATGPMLHDPCHPYDATRLVAGNVIRRSPCDAAGGWHDAGDYVKFLNTAAFTTYTLLFAYDFDPVKFGFDNDRNGTPDILEEARVGLDWLTKLAYTPHTFITQVQDLRDHDQGWRKPERDLLAHDRPGFVGVGKNLIGVYSATMALATRIWRRNTSDADFAERCLTLSENFYSIRNEAPDIDTSGSGMYRDTRYLGKLALAAVELHLATGRTEYLAQAKAYADSAGSDYWWSWGDINAYAQYRLAKSDPRYAKYILSSLLFFNAGKNKRIFGEAVEDSWGSNTAILGAALHAILWKDITGAPTFDSLAACQRDFVLGRNPWGVSFVNGIGTLYSRRLHSQVAHFNGGRIPGAVAAGPVSAARLARYTVPFERADEFAEFQSESAVYRDDRMDYVTNEPTIATNAVAVFVMGYYSQR